MTFEKKSKSEIYYIHVNANRFFGPFYSTTYVGSSLHAPTWLVQFLSVFEGHVGKFAYMKFQKVIPVFLDMCFTEMKYPRIGG